MPGFDASDDFAFDKPAQVACRHLAEDFRCTIHARRAALGMGGCIAHDCLGAGQRVCEALAPDLDWRAGPEARARLAEVFAATRAVHGVLELLAAAERLPLTGTQEAERRALVAELRAEDADQIIARATGPAPDQARAFLRSLAAGLSAG